MLNYLKIGETLKLKRTIALFQLVLLMLVLSCGRTDDAKLKDTDKYDIGEKTSCELKPEVLSKIFEEDITVQLDCLEKSLNLFLSFVDLPDENKIGKEDLIKFIDRFFPKHKKETARLLEVVLDLNEVFFREISDGFAVYQINGQRKLRPEILQIAKIINFHGRKIRTLYNEFEKDNQTYWVKRREFMTHVKLLSNKLLVYINQKQNNYAFLRTLDFIKKQDLTDDELDLNYELIEAGLFLKKLIIGGEPELLTASDAKSLVEKASNIVPIVFDLNYLDSIDLKSETLKSKFYLQLLNRLEKDILEFKPDEYFLTHEDMLILMKEVFQSDIDLTKLEGNIIIVKQLLINDKSTYPVNYTYKNVIKIKELLKEYLETRFFNNITYESLHDQMTKPGRIGLLTRPEEISADNLNCRLNRGSECIRSQYDIYHPARIEELWKKFKYLAEQYRYYRDETGKQYYSDKFTRTVEGFSEVSTTRFIFSRLTWAYSCPINIKYNYFHQCSINKDQFSKFLDDFQPVLQELKVWPPNKLTFIQNTILLSDLFQFQANGDGKINTDEITEYGIMAFAAIDSGEELVKAFKGTCPVISEGLIGTDEDNSKFAVACYRKNFFKIFLEKLDYKKAMPKLHQYIAKLTQEEVIEFLKHVEEFARDFPSDSIPMGNRDFMLVVGALLNIEGTLVRYDVNNSNNIEYKELILAFEIYDDAIMAIAEIDDREFAKSAFFYMIKEKNLPDSWLDKVSLLMFHWFGDKEKIIAERVNIGALMNYIRTMSDIKNKTLRTPPENVENFDKIHAEAINDVKILKEICSSPNRKIIKECIDRNIKKMKPETTFSNDFFYLSP